MSDQHEGPWANDVIYGKLLPHVKNMGYTDWVRLGDACAVMQQMRDEMQTTIAALRQELAARQWEPVHYSTFVEDQCHNETYLLITLDGSSLEIGTDPTRNGVTVQLPSDMRLCRKRTAQEES